jgi:protein-disulfide isomerase
MMAAVVGGIALGCVTTANAEPVQGLMNPAVFQDIFVGEKTAPVTLVVYSSPTCGHCIDFHDKDLPKLQNMYVTPRKLKIAYRPFVRNSVDAVIFMLANARGQDKFDETVSTFMSKFDEIASASNAEDALREIAASMGIDRAAFDRALADQAYLNKLNAATTEANQKFGVAGTPSFFVNGERIEVKRSFDEVADAVRQQIR